MPSSGHNTPRRWRLWLTAAMALTTLLPLLMAYGAGPAGGHSRPRPPIRALIPRMPRYTMQKIFLEHANEVRKYRGDSFIVLVGDVLFTRGPMSLKCDSAHYYPNEESMNAFGNVEMQQGDTLFVYADELNYDGPAQMAYLYSDAGKDVRMINRDVSLVTPDFTYDLGVGMGYYTAGGTLTDSRNRLVSIEGEYTPDTKEANFYGNVHLNSRSARDTLNIYTDTLYYNTRTHLAEFYSPTTIVNSQATMWSSDGSYNTNTNVGDFYAHSRVVTRRGSTLEGDTLFYDRKKGYGEAFGNMVLTDSVKKSTLMGEYGYYNELTDSAYVTGRALAMEYSRKDTLYVHAGEIFTYRAFDTIYAPGRTVPVAMSADGILINTLDSSEIDLGEARLPANVNIATLKEVTFPSSRVLRVDTTHILVAHPGVRYYRTDLQGLCDSMQFEQRDSMLYMYRSPIVWSGERQIFGNEMQVHLNDSTADRVHLPDFGLTAQHVEEEFYDQLAGKQMTAYLTGGDLRHIDVSGNVQAIYLPQEDDSTYNKIFTIESATLAADFLDREILRAKFWPQSTSVVTPLWLAKRSSYYLPQFRWYEELRPISPMDVFVYPEGMDELLHGGALQQSSTRADTPTLLE